MSWSFYNASGKLIDGVIDGSITNAKLADDAVGADELAANAVVDASIATGAAIQFSKMENLTASRLLVSDGSGDVSVSSVTTTNLTDLTDTGATTLHTHAGGGGKILQAATAIFSGTQTITTDDNSFTDITNLSVNITPAANTSKILILVCIGKHDTHSDANTTQFIVYRGSHRLNTGNGAASTDTTVSNRIAASFTGGVSGHSNGNGNQHFSCLDSPATASQITYVVAASCHSNDVEINRWRTDSDDGDGPSTRTASSITVLEVGA